ncbi:MAG: hypothetical protein HGGPFJEG_01956 [Ignavibacteria bacterium]|nr:hypothetical protein [Ignavibacteria bacterium]
MKSIQFPAIAMAILFIALCNNAFPQNQGETIFKQVCAACHTIGSGKLVGPDLANVHTRHTKEWIISFVKSSQSVIKSGDKYADSLFKAFNQVPMPDNPTLTNDQIEGIIAYITEKSSSPGTSTTKADLPPGDVHRGQELFVGNIRFANHGAACNSCHNVDMSGLVSGGALGKDLTQVVSRISVTGVQGVVAGLPFPQMKQAYESKPLTDQEIADVTAFLKEANDLSVSAQAGNDIGEKMLFGGISGAVLLLFLFSLFWIKRKQRTVNYTLFKRQISST